MFHSRRAVYQGGTSGDHLAGARGLQQAQRQHLLLHDTIHQLSRAPATHGESHLRGGADTGEGADEGAHARTPDPM